MRKPAPPSHAPQSAPCLVRLSIAPISVAPDSFGTAAETTAPTAPDRSLATA